MIQMDDVEISLLRDLARCETWTEAREISGALVDLGSRAEYAISPYGQDGVRVTMPAELLETLGITAPEPEQVRAPLAAYRC